MKIEKITAGQVTRVSAALALVLGSTVLTLSDAAAAGGNKKYCDKTASMVLTACN